MDDPAAAYLIRRQQAEGLTNPEMARKLGISLSYWHYLAHNKKFVTVRMAHRLRSVYPELLLIVLSGLTAPDSKPRQERAS